MRLHVQITLVSTIAPVGDATAPATFGSELAAALVMGPTGPSGLQVSCRWAGDQGRGERV